MVQNFMHMEQVLHMETSTDIGGGQMVEMPHIIGSSFLVALQEEKLLVE